MSVPHPAAFAAALRYAMRELNSLEICSAVYLATVVFSPVFLFTRGLSRSVKCRPAEVTRIRSKRASTFTLSPWRKEMGYNGSQVSWPPPPAVLLCSIVIVGAQLESHMWSASVASTARCTPWAREALDASPH